MDAPQAPRERSDRGSTLIAAAILGAAFVLSWGMSSAAPRYELAGSGDSIVRMDTDSGELIACNQQRCTQVEPPDRAKTLGPLTLKFGSKPKAVPRSANLQQNEVAP